MIQTRGWFSDGATEDSGYQVIVPALPGIVTYGGTLDESREMARDANIEPRQTKLRLVVIRGLLKDNEEIPEGPFAASQPAPV